VLPTTRFARATTLLLLAVAVALSAAAAVDAAASRRLADLALKGRALDYARGLTDEVGARLTGSSSYRRAAAWAVERFRDAGVTTVDVEPFTIARGWERGGPARGRIVTPIEQPIAVQSFGWAPSTPGGGVEGEVVAGGDQIDITIDRVRGRIVLLDGRSDHNGDAKLKRAGALAVALTGTCL
jgi:hypothetical protein